ncbi:putative DMT superfamily transporter inner membrane protein [bacterium BMS3Abin14]|nr:putative DMT superfamily transporter inner membrane protein [bacterium BMS3Abin14]
MRTTHSTGTVLPIAAILAAMLLWGGSFAAMKVTIAALGPWTVIWIRMAVALVIILPLARRFPPLHYRPGDWKLLILFVIFEPCLYFIFEANALRFTSSSQAGVISASLPLMVAFGANFALGERVSRATVFGLCLSLGGVVWLTMAGDPSAAAMNPVLGNVLEFGAMVSAAGYVLLVKRLSEWYSPWTLTALQIVTGAVFFLPGAFPLLDGRAAAIGVGEILALLYLGAFVTLGAYGLYNFGLSRIPANHAAAFVNLIPVVAVFLGWKLLGETLNSGQIAATLCVLAGVWLSQAGWGRLTR